MFFMCLLFSDQKVRGIGGYFYRSTKDTFKNNPDRIDYFL